MHFLLEQATKFGVYHLQLKLHNDYSNTGIYLDDEQES